MDGKRKHGGGGGKGGGKKSKKFYYKMATMGKAALVGKKGILVTCDQNRERRSTEELYRMLDEYVDKFYPNLKKNGDEQESDEDENLTIEESLAKEISDLQKESKERKSRFMANETGCKGTFFMIINEPKIDPVEFVKKIFDDIEASQVPKTRFTSRMIPIQKTCSANDSEIIRTVKAVADPIFNTESEPGKKYAIIYKCKNNSDMDRESIIRDTYSQLHMKNMVDLKNPDWVIIVEIVKKTCCVAVTNEWQKYNKFNIRLSLEEEKQKTQEQREKSIKEVAEKKAAAASTAPTTEEKSEVESKEESKSEVE